MTKKDFLKLHLNLTISNAKTVIINPLPSDTDPTQDIPIKMIEVTAAGVPINVKEFKKVFNNLPADALCTAEKRNFDQFDQLGELQQLAGSMTGKVTTDYKPIKKQKKHES